MCSRSAAAFLGPRPGCSAPWSRVRTRGGRGEHWRVAWRPRRWCLCRSWDSARPGSTRRWAQAGPGRHGREKRGPRPGPGSGLPRRGGGCSRRLPARPRPAACEWSSPGLFPELPAGAPGCLGCQRPCNQLWFGLTRSHTLKEVWEAEKGTGLILGVGGKGRDREGKKIECIFLSVPAS